MLSYNAGSSSYSVVEHHIIMETYRMGSECGYEDIIRVTCYDKSTISRAAASLERKDIVESFPDPGGSRRKRVRLNEKGKIYAVKTIKDALAAEQDYYRCLTKEQKDRMYHYIVRFYDQLRENEKPDEFAIEWPVIGHYSMNAVKYIEHNAPLFRDESREASLKYILLSLLHQGGESTYKKTESKYAIEQTVVVRQMRKLIARGLAENCTSGPDKRVKAARLTEAGRREAEKIRDVCFDLENRACKGFSREEIEEFAEFQYLILKEIDKVGFAD